MDPSAREIGRHLLSELEEVTLEDLLPVQTKPYPLSSLPSLIASRPPSIPPHPPVTTTGRGALSLVYALIAVLVSPPHNYALAVVDYSYRFDCSRLLLPSVPKAALRRVHTVSPPRATPLRDVLESIDGWLLGGGHGSMGMKWWGVISIGAGWGSAGGDAAVKGVDLLVGHGGWLKVDRAGVEERPLEGLSIEEALALREADKKRGSEPKWRAESPWGAFEF